MTVDGREEMRREKMCFWNEEKKDGGSDVGDVYDTWRKEGENSMEIEEGIYRSSEVKEGKNVGENVVNINSYVERAMEKIEDRINKLEVENMENIKNVDCINDTNITSGKKMETLKNIDDDDNCFSIFGESSSEENFLKNEGYESSKNTSKILDIKEENNESNKNDSINNSHSNPQNYNTAFPNHDFRDNNKAPKNLINPFYNKYDQNIPNISTDIKNTNKSPAMSDSPKIKIDLNFLSQKNEKKQELLLTFKTTEKDQFIQILGHYVKSENNRTICCSFYLNNRNKIELLDLQTGKIIDNFGIQCALPGTYKVRLRIHKRLEDFSYMFYDCKNLTEVSGYIDASLSRTFKCMFWKCHSLTSVKFRDIDVSSVKNYEKMFCYCYSLTSLSDLQQWNFTSSRNFSYMFYKCCSLRDLKGIRRWNVRNVSSFMCMFRHCEKIKNLDDFRLWKVNNEAEFIGMFSHCVELENAEGIREWTGGRKSCYEGIFNGCLKLKVVPWRFRF